MKAIITKEDVSAAIEKLKFAGKKTTLHAIHSALGNRGSISTLVKLKAEIESGARQAKDDETGLQAFRDIWAQAVEQGRAIKEEENAWLRDSLEIAEGEAEQSQGETLAAREQLAKVESQRDSLISDLAAANAALTSSRADGSTHSQKLAEVMERVAKLQESHAAELASAAAELKSERERAHRLEIELAKLEAVAALKKS